MIAIANVGKFVVEGSTIVFEKVRRKLTRSNLKPSSALGEATEGGLMSAILVLIAFLAYVLLGAMMLPLWEDWKFFDGFYFSFISITTCGFGDIVPEDQLFLFPTLLYLTMGLAITTMTIEVASGYLKKLHYLGSTIKNASMALVWFGNRVLTVGELVTTIGKQYGVSDTEIEELVKAGNLDRLVEVAVEQRERKLGANRPKFHPSNWFGPPPLFHDLDLRYIDDSVSSSDTDLLRTNSKNPSLNDDVVWPNLRFSHRSVYV